MSSQISPAQSMAVALTSIASQEEITKPAEMRVTSYLGRPILLRNAIKLTHGRYAGEWASRYDSSILKLTPDRNCYCLSHEVVASIDGHFYHPDHFSEFGIDRDRRSGSAYNFTRNMTLGVFNVIGSVGYFSGTPVRCETNNVAYISEAIAQRHGLVQQDGKWYHPADQRVKKAPVVSKYPAVKPFDSTVNPLAPRTLPTTNRSGDTISRTYSEYNNAGYHSLPRIKVGTAGQGRTIGVEIEKEDSTAQRIPFLQVWNTFGWCKENDGSLGHGGYELVSPTFDLDTNDLINDVNNSDKLRQLIDASHSNSCGGHIHIGVKGMNDNQLFDQIAGYMPMLYGLYERRAGYHYCSAIPNSRIKSGGGGGSYAIRMKGDHIEIRLFSAVRSVRNLQWRIELIRVMLDNPHSEPGAVVFDMLDDSSRLHRHLRTLYTEEQLLSRAGKAVKWANKLEGKSLNIKIIASDVKKKKEAATATAAPSV